MAEPVTGARRREAGPATGPGQTAAHDTPASDDPLDHVTDLLRQLHDAAAAHDDD